MSNQKFCQECSERAKCQEAYQELGKIKGPSIAFKVVYVFLLPLIVFIIALAAFEKISVKMTNSRPLQIALGCLLAFSASFVCILITKAINKRFGKEK